MNLRKYFLYCLSFSLVFVQSTAFGFVANNTELNKVANNSNLNKSESHENYVKYSHTESALIVKNEQTHCAIPIHEELQTEIELNLPEIQKQNKAEFPTDTQIADNKQIQGLTVCPPEIAQELLDSSFSGEMQYGNTPAGLGIFFYTVACSILVGHNQISDELREEQKPQDISIAESLERMVCLPLYGVYSLVSKFQNN